MKILLFNGSPKGEASDTMHLTRAFLDGVNSVSRNEVTYVDVASKHIEYCRGCLTCKKNGGKCVIDDEMADLLVKILYSDLLIFSFPPDSAGSTDVQCSGSGSRHRTVS